jgi:hypothetical protein
MSSSTIGLFTGLILGIAWGLGGFDAFVGTAVLGLIGFVVGKIAAGQIDLQRYLGGSSQRRR